MPDGKLALENMQCSISRKTILALMNAIGWGLKQNASNTALQLLATAQLRLGQFAFQ
jgi:hypothetical protein